MVPFASEVVNDPSRPEFDALTTGRGCKDGGFSCRYIVSPSPLDLHVL